MVHPFDVELGDDGHIYISCQDTNTVVALAPEARKPALVAAHLRKQYPKGNFSPARSSRPVRAAFLSTATALRSMCRRPSALELCSTSAAAEPRHSVRGIVVYRKHLYVADEAGDVVKVFSVKSGELMAHITGRALEAARCTWSCMARRSISEPRAVVASSRWT